MKRNVEYFINEDKGIVVAKMTCPVSNEVEEEVSNLCNKSQSSLRLCDNDEIFITSLNGLLTIDMPDNITLRAIARCHPNDSFDLEKGKEIAYRKLMIKYFKARQKYLNDYFNVLSNLVSRIKFSLEHSDNAIKRLENEMQD